jgi:hypothetical protein
MSSSTSTSKKWLLFYLAALLLAAGVGWIYATRFEPETQFWTKVFQARRAEMAKRPDVPHVIFTGDSACAFGIDAKVFTEESGVPSFNLGGTRQMGLEIFMEEALRQTRKGDYIVLICNPRLLVESESSSMTKAGTQMALSLSAETTFSEKITASRPGFNHLITHGAKIGLRRPAFAYQIAGYQAGGLVTTEERPQQSGQSDTFEFSESDLITASHILFNWAIRCEKEGATLFYLMPLEFTSQEMLAENRKRKEAALTEFIFKTSSVSFPNPPRRACSSDDTLFADTLYHLTSEGAESFTRELTPEIVRMLERRNELQNQ